MTLKHFKIFVAVCETGSQTAASEKLFIAQPSISVAIAELEEHYGIKLFDRIAQKLHITGVGKHFLQYAMYIVSSCEILEKEIKNYDEIGVINIGASITIGNYLLGGYLTGFKKIYPKIEVRVFIANSEEIQKRVMKNQIDIGLIEGIIHNPYIVEQPFSEDELVLICSKDHLFSGRKNVSIFELQGQKFILRESGSAGREIFESVMTAYGLEINPAWESISTQAIIRAVHDDFGISILPYLLVKESIDRNEIALFYLKEHKFIRQYRIIYHKNKFLTTSAKDFIALCLKYKS